MTAQSTIPYTVYRIPCIAVWGKQHPSLSLSTLHSDEQRLMPATPPTVQVIVSFRGTEQVKFKDILTDINMMQVLQLVCYSTDSLQIANSVRPDLT